MSFSARRYIRDNYYVRYVPEPTRNFLLALRRTDHWKKQGLILVQIPKCAGYSLSVAIYGEFLGHIPIGTIRMAMPFAFSSLPSFAVSRNPWRRCYSAYVFARRGSGVGEKDVARVFNPERYQVDEASSFERFVKEWLIKQDLTNVDPIFQTQSSYVCDSSGRPIVTKMGKVEEMADAVQYLEHILQRKIMVERLNISGADADNYRKYYDASMRDIVAKLYADDVKNFNYDF